MSDLFSSLPPDRLADFRPRPTDTDHISESGLDLNMDRHIPREISHVTITRATDASARWPVTCSRGMERLRGAVGAGGATSAITAVGQWVMGRWVGIDMWAMHVA